jgi:hypothetical protein
MRKIQPTGEAAEAPYIDGNLAAGIPGSRVPAEFFNSVVEELVHLIVHSGQTPSSSDLQQVRKAVAAMIAAAAGGGGGDPIDTSNFVLMGDARVSLPIHAEIMTADGKMTVTAVTPGTVRLAGGQTLIHRGVFSVTTSQTDFPTSVNKTYHLRWSKAGGFALKDLADSGYNAGGLNEANAAFDTTFDDVLLARIVTDASNVATIKTLVNRARLRLSGAATGPRGQYTFNNPEGAGYQNNVYRSADIVHFNTIALDWGRRGFASLSAMLDVRPKGGDSAEEFSVGIAPVDRYSLKLYAHGDRDIAVEWIAFD